MLWRSALAAFKFNVKRALRSQSVVKQPVTTAALLHIQSLPRAPCRVLLFRQGIMELAEQIAPTLIRQYAPTARTVPVAQRIPSRVILGRWQQFRALLPARRAMVPIRSSP